jgi:hypothetical protein
VVWAWINAGQTTGGSATPEPRHLSPQLACHGRSGHPRAPQTPQRTRRKVCVATAASLVTKHVQPSIYFFLTEQAVAKIGGNAFHVPPVKWPVHKPAIGIDVEIRGALNCGEEAMASYNGGAQEFVASCEAEVVDRVETDTTAVRKGRFVIRKRLQIG